MNYKVIQKKNTYAIVEKSTDHIVAFGVEKEMKTRCRFLNLGGAFDGWTPSFVLKKIFVEKFENTVSGYK